jgi:3-oxoacyl-[acyl-carrier-protein] synthase-3
MDYGGMLKMGGGPNVQRRAVNAMSGALDFALSKSGMSVSDLDMILPHQANLRIIVQLQKKLKITEDKVVITIQDMGNLGGATSAIALDKYRKGVVDYKYKKGETLLGMTVVGGGYTYSSIIMYI